ncbi:ubiquinone biosynthesis protein UbiA [Cellulosimicrobium cellulans]|uniref:Ubiquinone biosynthesis protein UbiA n=1 Tax=Cellulosimicrobium cellulans TaxID=1710 RepID=A0A1Y0HY84_CELCE|nr:UbiA family prenyltransferase [Cellulosimicrobium cellulans]ARU53157.1 ubiquinone biosynthesis protein UbiA [Cellulosimicrobium cellulans]
MVTGRPRGLVRGLVVASHFPPTVMVTAFALALSAGIGAGARTTTLVALAVLAGQLSVGWSNDWLDARRDLAVGRADKPVVTGLVTPAALRAAALAALGACVVLSLATGVVPGLVHVVAVASAWSYNALLKATWWSWAPYALSFGLLAVFVVLAAPGNGRPAPWAVVAAALLGVGAHVANTLPDLEDDAATGVRGLPHRLGRRASSVLAPVLLGVAALLVVVAPPGAPDAAAWVLGGAGLLVAGAAGVVGVVRPRSRAPFALSMAVAGVCVVLLVLAAPAVVVPG